MTEVIDKSALLYTVFPSAEQAKIAARKLVQEKLVACANILPAHIAIYEWECELQESEEVAMLLKTTQAKREEAEARVAELHEYEVACVISVDIASGNADFLRWIADSVK